MSFKHSPNSKPIGELPFNNDYSISKACYNPHFPHTLQRFAFTSGNGSIKTNQICTGLIVAPPGSKYFVTACGRLAINNVDVCSRCFYVRQYRIKSKL